MRPVIPHDCRAYYAAFAAAYREPLWAQLDHFSHAERRYPICDRIFQQMLRQWLTTDQPAHVPQDAALLNQHLKQQWVLQAAHAFAQAQALRAIAATRDHTPLGEVLQANDQAAAVGAMANGVDAIRSAKLLAALPTPNGQPALSQASDSVKRISLARERFEATVLKNVLSLLTPHQTQVIHDRLVNHSGCEVYANVWYAFASSAQHAEKSHLPSISYFERVSSDFPKCDVLMWRALRQPLFDTAIISPTPAHAKALLDDMNRNQLVQQSMTNHTGK